MSSAHFVPTPLALEEGDAAAEAQGPSLAAADTDTATTTELLLVPQTHDDDDHIIKHHHVSHHGHGELFTHHHTGILGKIEDEIEELNYCAIHALSPRLLENLHIYLWILKDYAWVQLSNKFGHVASTMTLIWCLFLFITAAYMRYYEEMYMVCGVTLWLAGNYVWMSGEDEFFGTDETNVPIALHIFLAAVVWYGLYYCVWKPFGVLKPSSEQTRMFEEDGLSPKKR